MLGKSTIFPNRMKFLGIGKSGKGFHSQRRGKAFVIGQPRCLIMNLRGFKNAATFRKVMKHYTL